MANQLLKTGFGTQEKTNDVVFALIRRLHRISSSSAHTPLTFGIRSDDGLDGEDGG